MQRCAFEITNCWNFSQRPCVPTTKIVLATKYVHTEQYTEELRSFYSFLVIAKHKMNYNSGILSEAKLPCFFDEC